jgi:hypothetical protein
MSKPDTETSSPEDRYLFDIFLSSYANDFLQSKMEQCSSPIPADEIALDPEFWKASGLGGGTFRCITKYIPLLVWGRLDSVEVANEQ